MDAKRWGGRWLSPPGVTVAVVTTGSESCDAESPFSGITDGEPRRYRLQLRDKAENVKLRAATIQLFPPGLGAWGSGPVLLAGIRCTGIVDGRAVDVLVRTSKLRFGRPRARLGGSLWRDGGPALSSTDGRRGEGKLQYSTVQLTLFRVVLGSGWESVFLNGLAGGQPKVTSSVLSIPAARRGASLHQTASAAVA